MADLSSPPTALTIQLPADLVQEPRLLANEKRRTVDEIVREACLAYAEPYLWERQYKEWLQASSEQVRSEFGIGR